MNKIFALIELGTSILAAVPTIQALIRAKALTGAALYSTIQPALFGLGLLGIKIPQALVLSIADSVAGAVEQYYASEKP